MCFSDTVLAGGSRCDIGKQYVYDDGYNIVFGSNRRFNLIFMMSKPMVDTHNVVRVNISSDVDSLRLRRTMVQSKYFCMAGYDDRAGLLTGLCWPLVIIASASKLASWATFVAQSSTTRTYLLQA